MGKKLSNISKYHYIKLIFHSLLFIGVLVLYIINRVHGLPDIFENFDYIQIVLIVIWAIFLIEMVFRFFPSRLESQGCQKIFKRNYQPHENGNIKPRKPNPWRTFAVASVWIIANLLIGMIYLIGWIDQGILILISLLYSIGDMVCILFFCPFQTWFLKNKCCNTCRIYNWDFAMMVTPLVFIPNFFTWSLVGVSLALLLKWEIMYKVYPERFVENTNRNLLCANCKEKLCVHKKQLKKYLKKFQDRFFPVQSQSKESQNENKVLTEQEKQDSVALD